MYMIVIGAGKVGESLIEIALEDRNDVVLIESDRERAEEINRNFDDLLVLHADATSVEVLNEAGVSRADALVATTADDATNLMVIALGKELDVSTLISVVNERDHGVLFHRLGAHVVEDPEEIVARHLYSTMQRPKIRDLVTLSGGAQLFEATLTERSSLVGKTIQESGHAGLIPDKTLIVAVERDDEQIIPVGKTLLNVGDQVTVITQQPATDDLVGRITG
ncbi:MAG: potassium channel family protein [Candidatus Bipolaricaulia bacterium]